MSKGFYDDSEKMRDFMSLDRAQFLESYSYVTDEEYEATAQQVIADMERRDLRAYKVDVPVMLDATKIGTEHLR